MTSKGHVIFSLSVVIFLKKINLLLALSYSNWGHIIVGSIVACLLPDIDHPKSWLGQKLKWFSIPISKLFGHRGFTHSVLAIIIFSIFLHLCFSFYNLLPIDIVQIMIISYISHIMADMLTPFGVPLFWPILFRFRIPIINTNKNKINEQIFCLMMFIWSILYPINFPIFEYLIKIKRFILENI